MWASGERWVQTTHPFTTLERLLRSLFVELYQHKEINYNQRFFIYSDREIVPAASFACTVPSRSFPGREDALHFARGEVSRRTPNGYRKTGKLWVPCYLLRFVGCRPFDGIEDTTEAQLQQYHGANYTSETGGREMRAACSRPGTVESGACVCVCV